MQATLSLRPFDPAGVMVLKSVAIRDVVQTSGSCLLLAQINT